MAFKFRYFPLWAKGPAIALALEHNDFEWEGENQGEWAVLKQETPWRELPILEIPGFGMMGHEIAILNFLGDQKESAGGSTQAEKLVSGQIMAEAEDIYQKLVKYQDTIGSKGKNSREDNVNLWEGSDRSGHNKTFGLPVMLGLLEEYYQARKVADGFFTTSGCSVGECKLFACLRNLVLIKKDMLAAFPGLTSFYGRFEAHEKTQAILTTGGKMPQPFKQYFIENTYDGAAAVKVEPGPGPSIYSSPVTLHYFPAGGRAELSRLIAAAGRVELIEGGMPGKDVNKSDFGSPSGVPLLQHGALKMSQSNAIENYLSLLAFPDLPPQMRAIDSQFCSIKEDVAAGTYKVLFSPMIKEDKEKAAEELKKNASRWYTIIEQLCPADGFINGQGYPTAADVAVLNMCDTVMSFGICNKIAGVDWAIYPKMRAVANRTASFPSVKEYLAKSATFTANPMGL